MPLMVKRGEDQQPSDKKKLTLRLSSQTGVPNVRSLEYFDKHRHSEPVVARGIRLAVVPRK